MSTPLDLDNPPEEAKPYVALYELRMADVRKLTIEVATLCDVIDVTNARLDAAHAEALAWREKYEALQAQLTDVVKGWP